MRAITDEKGNIVNDGKKLPENYFQVSKSDSESTSSLSSVSSKSLDSLKSPKNVISNFDRKSSIKSSFTKKLIQQNKNVRK